MKIAIISTMASSPWGGSEYLWSTMASDALAEGHEIIISLYDWSISHPRIINLKKNGAKTLPRPRSEKISLLSRIFQKISRRFLPNKVSLKQSYFKPIFDENPDVICISQGSSFDSVHIPDLFKLLLDSGIPYFLVCQFNSDIYFPVDKRDNAVQLYHQAKKVAFVSKHNLNLAERQIAERISNALVIQNPVNLADHNYISFPSQTKINIACVARLEIAFKGQELLFEALSSPEWHERNWQCNLYGSGPDEDYLRSLAIYYNINDRIHFQGHIPNVQSIWADNKILVLPSRGEGTPLALIEAMICGRPAVVTDVGGNVEWIEEGKTGFIAEAPTAKLINTALNRAWQIQDKWEDMGKTAHKLAMEKLDLHPGKTLLNLLTQ